ncbi:hypothetical protein DFP98_16124 [Cohnella phaseoli]|uniref:Uncharacterized protein n=1 Tax=Cohnella phaseoli TaxID=456490 RepID=A0A3D9HQU1_9BACL|nr:hypothetical protein DFP98_16124 [Cohnella phaseoli]
METQNDTAVIKDSEFIVIVNAAKDNDSKAILQLIELFKTDILYLSKYICLPVEEVISEIIVEFLEFVHKDIQ